MKRLLALLLPFVAACALAQDVAVVVPKQIEDLKWQIGEWQGTVKMTVEGMDMDMVSTLKISQKDNVLVYDGMHEAMGSKMTELGYLWWDEAKKRYSMFTLASFGEVPRMEHGTLTGNTLVMTSEPWPIQGQVMESRAHLIKVGNDEIKFIIDFKEGDKWTKAGEGVYKRKK